MNTKAGSKRYTRLFIIIIVSLFLLTSIVVYFAGMVQKTDMFSFIFAGIFNVTISVVSFVLITGSLESSRQKFMIYSFGSITARLFVMIIVILAGLLIFKFNKISFIFAILFFYFLFLFIETVLLVKRVNNKKKESLS